ncbi:MAG: hypothetical protein H5T86_16915, partial [Armatimonadetes bacterium]|nr:hypothetical protein [Armatimonadota bacterium]
EQTVGDIVAELASQFFYLRIEDNTQVVPTASASGPVAERVRELAEQKVAALMQQAEEARAAGNESKAKEYEEAAGIVREAGALVVRRLRTWERET